MAKQAFQKPLISLPQQVQKLADRGLIFDDVPSAVQRLKFIGYYRLSGYYKFFCDPDDPARENFRTGTNFNDVLNLYGFDRRLRVLLAEALERIEIAVKTSICHEYSARKGVFWMTDPDNFWVSTHD